MELLQDYDSENSDSDVPTKVLKVDFFNLEESEEEDGLDSVKDDILCQATKLRDKPLGPIPIKNDDNKDKNSAVLQTPVKKTFHKNKTFSCPNVHMATSIPVIKSDSHKTEDCINDLTKFVNHKDNIFDTNTLFFDNSGENNSLPNHLEKSIQGHTLAITALTWNPTQYNHLLLSSSIDASIKIWNVFSSQCVKQYNDNLGIKSAKWSICGTKLIWGGYNKKACLMDVNSEKLLSVFPVKDYVSSVQVHPELSNIFLVGTKDKVLAFDKRDDPTPVRTYSSNCQYVLDLAFMKNGTEFIASTDVVSHDCADRTLMVWDFASGAILSNQIYCECYTCPWVTVSPDEHQFVAQSNGNYIAVFSTKRPYKLKNQRFMGHEVLGYSIGCDFSPDSQILVSGDAKGGLYFYNSYNCHLIKKINAKTNVPLTRVNWHPVSSSLLATGFWDGLIKIWK